MRKKLSAALLGTLMVMGTSFSAFEGQQNSQAKRTTDVRTTAPCIISRNFYSLETRYEVFQNNFI